jgi:hypothetical protein
MIAMRTRARVTRVAVGTSRPSWKSRLLRMEAPRAFATRALKTASSVGRRGTCTRIAPCLLDPTFAFASYDPRSPHACAS